MSRRPAAALQTELNKRLSPPPFKWPRSWTHSDCAHAEGDAHQRHGNTLDRWRPDVAKGRAVSEHQRERLAIRSDGGQQRLWLVTAEVIGPGVGDDKWRFVVSRDDGQSWDFDHTVEFYNPGRPIGGRACPKTVQLNNDTLGTVFYDVDPNQPGGSGIFFLRTPIAKLAPAIK